MVWRLFLYTVAADASDTCCKTCPGSPHGGIVGLKDLTTDSGQVLMSALSQQPVSIAINADQSSFQLFKTGVLAAGKKLVLADYLAGVHTAPCCTLLDGADLCRWLWHRQWYGLLKGAIFVWTSTGSEQTCSIGSVIVLV